MEFLLGFSMADVNNDIYDNLVQFESVEQANFEAEEWVSIEAESLDEAKEKYEECFTKWQENNNK